MSRDIGTVFWTSGVETNRAMQPVDQVARDLQTQLHNLPFWTMAEQLTTGHDLQLNITLNGAFLSVRMQSITR